MAKTGRNDLCPCGSGRKFKQCCVGKAADTFSSRLLLMALAAIIVTAILVAIFGSQSGSTLPGRVWSAEHGHYHDASGREVQR